MKSLFCTCPETGWYRVCFWIMRLRFAHVSSWKAYLPGYSAPYSVPISTFSLRILNHLHRGDAVFHGGVDVFEDDGLHPLWESEDTVAQLLPSFHPTLSQRSFSAEI